MGAKILVTGGAGFVATHLIEHILKNTDWDVVSLDRYDTSGNPNRLAEMLDTTPGIDKSRVRVVFWDLKAELNDQVKKQLGGPFHYIAHLAAGSHVDRSIEDPMGFFMDNCIGTVNLLQYARAGGLAPFFDTMEAAESGTPSWYHGKFLYFSTDEVYGPAPMNTQYELESGKESESFLGFKEWARLNPNNPYAAAKAAAEMAVIAYANTYRIPCVITNTMNIFGERQHPEKFVPLIINKTLSGEKLFIHANKEKTQAGKRHYLHARNICAATVWVLKHGKTLDGSATIGRYNVVGEREVDNEEMAKLVSGYVQTYSKEHAIPCAELNYELVDFHSSRPGHDLRYALAGGLLQSEGFVYPVGFEESLKKFVYWTLDHKEKWL
jgi:dTDP-glucose 4,6-dehydratase